MNKIIVILTYIPTSTHDKKKSQKYFLQTKYTFFKKYKSIYFNNLIIIKLNNIYIIFFDYYSASI